MPSPSIALCIVVILLGIPDNVAFPSRWVRRTSSSSRALTSKTTSRTTTYSSSSSSSSSSSLVVLFAQRNVVDDAISSTLEDGLLKMERVMSEDFFQTSSSSSSLKSLYTQCVKSVEIRQSSIPRAGLGLFARKNIRANTVVSFYPVHALGIDIQEQQEEEGTTTTTTTGFVSLKNDQEYFDLHPSNSQSSYLHCTDQPIFQRPSILQQKQVANLNNDNDDVNNGIPLYLDVNPNRPIVNGWMSQMINDGATVQADTQEGIVRYYEDTQRRRNCIHIPFGPSPIMATVTTQKVKRGQELLTTYGATYWLGVSFDVRGQDSITTMSLPAVQTQVRQTALDLTKCMQSASIVYANQLRSLQEEFNKL